MGASHQLYRQEIMLIVNNEKLKIRKFCAFTLIELLIVIAILSLLAGIAYPSYQGFVIKTRRADAQSELIKAQIEQSSFRITHPTYTSNASAAGLPSNNQYYAFSIVSASTHTYTLKAEAKATASQIDDKSACQTLYIDQSNTKTSDGSQQNNACWSN